MNAPLGPSSSGSPPVSGHSPQGPHADPSRHVGFGTGVRRAALVLAGAAVFLSVASLIKPAPRSATASPPAGDINGDFEIDVRKAFTTPVDVSSSDPSEAALARRLHESSHQEEATHPKGYRLLGTFEGREHMLRCWSTPRGVRYSVHTPNGRLLQDDLPADEVYRAFPDIDLEHLQLDPAHPGALMMVDTTPD